MPVLAVMALMATACATPPGGEEPAASPAEGLTDDGADDRTEDVAADPEAPAAGGPITIGTLVPFTGDYSWVGANVQPVVDLVVGQINDSGGIDGRQIDTVQGDTEGVVDAGVAAAQQLVQTQDVVAMIGPTSLSFTGVRQVIEDFGVPIISPTAGTVELDTAGTEYFFRTVPSDSLGGRAIARAVTDPEYTGGTSWERPALMVGDAPALVSFEEPIQSALEADGVELTSTIRFAVGKQSYRSEIAEVMAGDPDIIVLVAQPEDSAKIMKNAFEAGYEGDWFMTQDQTHADYVTLAGPQVVEGAFGLVETAPEGVEDRLAEFSEALGQEPGIFQTNTYDAITITALAMLEAALAGEDITREAVNEHLRSVSNPDEGDVVVGSFQEGKTALGDGQGIDYQGLGGPIDFDEYGNVTAPFEIMRIEGGELTSVAYLPAEELELD